MKRILSVLLAACILLSLTTILSGCGKKKSDDWPVAYGGVTIDEEPDEIVVLNDIHADVISYLEYNDKMVGRSSECDQDFLDDIPVMGSAASPDVSAIKKADPDLVIADSTLSSSAKDSLESADIKVIVMDVPTDKDELKDLYIDLGTVLGGKKAGAEKGEECFNEFFDMLHSLKSSTSNILQTVAYLYLDENNELCTFTKGTMAFDFFNYNGNTNVFSNQDTPKVNPQELRLGSPNFIFYDSEEVLTYLAANDQFKHVKALVNEHTLMIPRKSFERYGSSTELAVFEMLRYIEQVRKATADEAAPTVAATTAPAATDATEAPAATTAETTAAAEGDEDDDEITYTIE